MVKSWHKKKWGINGIGYDYLITKNITHRGLGNAHTYGYNNTGIGICLTGDFQPRKSNKFKAEKPNAYQLKTLKKLAQKYSKQKLKIVGHRDLGKTVCPGDNLYKLLPHLTKKTMKVKDFKNYIKKIHSELKISGYSKVFNFTIPHWLKWFAEKAKGKRKEINKLKAKVRKLETENKGLKNNKTIKLSQESISEIAKAVIEKIRAIFWKSK